MIVVDANVLIHLHLPSGSTAAAKELIAQEPERVAPILWRSEFRNVLATQVRGGVLSLDQALLVQEAAEEFMSGSEYYVDSETVLSLAESSGCSAYDCEYVALARRVGCRLVTRDEQILRAFPEAACRLA